MGRKAKGRDILESAKFAGVLDTPVSDRCDSKTDSRVIDLILRTLQKDTAGPSSRATSRRNVVDDDRELMKLVNSCPAQGRANTCRNGVLKGKVVVLGGRAADNGD